MVQKALYLELVSIKLFQKSICEIESFHEIKLLQ